MKIIRNKKIVIIGASGHGKVIANIAKLNKYKEIVFLDDELSKTECGVFPIVGSTKNIKNYQDEYDFFIAIGDNSIREKISLELDKFNIKSIVLIHPNAIIDESVEIDKGTVVMANVVINSDVKIGKGCIINTSSSVDHDCIIGDYVHISPGVHLAGTVKLGKSCWLGVGVSLINNISVVDECVIGAGSVVISDINQSGTYAGIPIRRIK